jgi:hypothetical protein
MVSTLWRTRKYRIDVKRLERQIIRAGWEKAWKSLLHFEAEWPVDEPPAEEVERWANQGP